ncbi:MAG: hypothetical protein E7282_09365 [Lachnospiraceae bacterium]|nr:hypothetical protein [Lachnospiraceae bacterium]
MKKTGIIVLSAILVVMVVVGGYYGIIRSRQTANTEEQKLTEVEKINTRDLAKNYPSTPREVVKFYNRIITAYYAEKYTDEELSAMAEQARRLFDSELQDNNPQSVYLESVKADIEAYKSASKLISQSDVCDSDDVLYMTDKEDKIAYVSSSYFIKEGSNFSRTHEMYVLRKDTEGNWKILVYYQIEASEEASGNE